MRKRIACAAAVAVLFGFTGGAAAVAEAEPEAAAADGGAMEASEAASEAAPETSAPADAAPGTAAPAADAEPAPAKADGRVTRSAFTTEVVDREPTDALSTLTNDVEEVAYFTELRDFEGSTVVHRWSYGGEVVAEVPFEVDGPRWRVHSSKRLDPSALGEWSVSVVANGDVVSTQHLTYTDAPLPPAPPASPAAPEPGETSGGAEGASPAAADPLEGASE